MPEILGSFGPSNELESGLFPSVDQASAPLWVDGENVEFRGGGVQSSQGYAILASVPGTTLEMAQAYNEGDQRIYLAVGNGVYLRSNLTGLTPLGNFPAVGFPFFETYGTFLLATNFVDPPMYWKNAGALIPWPN